jgi:hypothetical protein
MFIPAMKYSPFNTRQVLLCKSKCKVSVTEEHVLATLMSSKKSEKIIGMKEI